MRNFFLFLFLGLIFTGCSNNFFMEDGGTYKQGDKSFIKDDGSSETVRGYMVLCPKLAAQAATEMVFFYPKDNNQVEILQNGCKEAPSRYTFPSVSDLCKKLKKPHTSPAVLQVSKSIEVQNPSLCKDPAECESCRTKHGQYTGLLLSSVTAPRGVEKCTGSFCDEVAPTLLKVVYDVTSPTTAGKMRLDELFKQYGRATIAVQCQ